MELKDQRACAFLILNLLLCPLVLHEGAELLLPATVQNAGQIPVRLPLAEVHAPEPCVGQLVVPSSTLLSREWQQGTVPRRAGGTSGALVSESRLSWALGSEHLANCEGPACQQQTLPSPYFSSQCPCNFRLLGNQELPLSYLKVFRNFIKKGENGGCVM